jgi:cellulose biosynthesis protein BcsQ
VTEAAGRKPGSIVTFYSYKGGTGRSMALANVAWILASNGYRVLTVDWDLEAPGLHRYFAPFLLDPELADSEGLIDIVNDYVTAAMTPPAVEPEPALLDDADVAEPKWYAPIANVLRYASSLDWKFKEVNGRTGWIDLIPAGKQGPAYATRMNSFSWQNFYDKLGGGGFIEAMKERMKAEYDYVLIDSRTGVSDTSGICTVQLPDALVVCFTLNRQSIQGASAVAASAAAQRNAGAPLRIFPVPTRVEKAEKDKLDMAREVAREAFAPFLTHVIEDEREQYWGDVEVFYEPFYAYEEILATFGDKPSQTASLLASMERITAWITDNEVSRLAPMDETERHRVVGEYARQGRKGKSAKSSQSSPRQEYLYYVSYAADDLDESLEQFVDDLAHQVAVMTGTPPGSVVGYVDFAALAGAGHDLGDALERSHVLVPLFSPAFFSTEKTGKEFHYFAAMLSDPARNRILPVMWERPTAPLPPAAAEIQWMDAELPDAYAKLGLRALTRLRRYASQYAQFIARFARLVVDAAERTSAARVPFSFPDVPNAFAAQPVVSQSDEGLVAAIQGFVKDVPSSDVGQIVKSANDLLSRLRSAVGTLPMPSIVRLLAVLAQRRLYDLTERFAEVLISNGHEEIAIRLWQARALAYQNKNTQALAVLQKLPRVAESPLQTEIYALLGQVYKELYLRADVRTLPRNRQNLALAIKAYGDASEREPHRLDHELNVAALAIRAANDGVQVSKWNRDAALATANKLLEEVQARVSTGTAGVVDYLVAAEACLALDQPSEMLQWLASYIHEPDVDAFALQLVLGQFVELWQLRPNEGVGQTVIPLLQAEILRREDGDVTISTHDIRERVLTVVTDDVASTFGTEVRNTMEWYRVGLDRARIVCGIWDVKGNLRGSGFLIRGSDLSASWSEGYVFVTSGNVVSPLVEAPQQAIHPVAARVDFDILGYPDAALGDVLFSSASPAVLIARATWKFGNVPRYFVALQPHRGGLQTISYAGAAAASSVSIQRDVLLYAHESRIRYRSPTRASWPTAGSPVFNEDWELVGMHDSTTRVPMGENLVDVTHDAISIDAIRRLVAGL